MSGGIEYLYAPTRRNAGGGLQDLMQNKIQEFIAWKRGYGLSPLSLRTYEKYLEKLDQHIKKPWEEITNLDIYSFQVLLLERYSKNYVAQLVRIWRELFRYFEGETQVKWTRLKPPPRPVPNSHQPIPKEHYLKLLSECREDKLSGLTLSLMLRLFFETGLRVSEMCELNISSLSQEEHLKPIAQIVTKKTGQLRFIMWQPETHERLIQYLGVRLTLNQEDHLFFAVKDKQKRRERITPRTIQRWIHELCDKAGLPRYHPHQFRTTFIRNLLRAGVSPIYVSKMAGHSETNNMAILPYAKFTLEENLNLWKKYADLTSVGTQVE